MSALVGLACLLALPAGAADAANKASNSPPLPAPPPVVTEQRPAPPSLTVSRVGDGEYQLGPVRFSKATDSLRIPVSINGQALGAPLEYLLVTEAGKVHESLLVTSTSATQVRVAMLLLGWRGSNDPVTLSLEGIQAPAVAKSAPEAWVEAAGQPLRKLEPRWQVQPSGGEMGASPDPVGQIIALIPDAGALIGYEGWGATNDVLWIAPTNGLPASSAELSLTIRRRKEGAVEGAK